ncbi:HIRAN domain-containing protein [Paeniglutamicibacter psychrophenolicus]|uniref:HIRAN domain-containing protein n=1 Tax=Paeniglutamicibacter psychrophenolicus TaxID=257454 RepID=UPI002786D22E|nr:HIRAN domain-containing protein [Paeniglutamicibacter psychrophenolicus]MDQ0094404.1 hypothetical protein [Paeniglutamicibacter psychrophenolicus]
MGFFQKLFGGRSSRDAVSTDSHKPPIEKPAPVMVNDIPAPQANVGVRERYRDLSPGEARRLERQAQIYDRERERAAAAGKSVKQLRAGLLGTEDTKVALAALKAAGEPMPKFRLRGCGKGLAIALPDGRVIDPTSIYLRPWDVYGAKIMGTGYYKAGSAQRSDGQQLSLKREPKNEHDPNAVAVMTRSGSAKIGYVRKGQAKWVAKAMDADVELVAHTVMGGSQVLITTPATWAAINGR